MPSASVAMRFIDSLDTLLSDLQANQRRQTRRIAAEGRAGAFPNDAATVQDNGRIGELEGQFSMLLDRYDGEATIASQPPERIDQPIDDDRGQSLEWLVEQDDLRISHQRTTNRQHLLLATSDLMAEVTLSLLQSREQFVHARKCPRTGRSTDLQVFFDRQGTENLALLRHETEAKPCSPMGGQLSDVPTGKSNRALMHRVQS